MTSSSHNSTPNTHWSQSEIVERHLDLAADYVAAYERRSFIDYMVYSALRPKTFPCGGCDAGMLESPLEAMWFIWWEAQCSTNRTFGELFDIEPQRIVDCHGQAYRLDFAVGLRDEHVRNLAEVGLLWPQLGVELDGHAFHEKTLEQVTYRNQRDRALQQADWRIFHYSFSEMNTNPAECVAEVFNFARNLWHAVNREMARLTSTPEVTRSLEEAVDAMVLRDKDQ